VGQTYRHRKIKFTLQNKRHSVHFLGYRSDEKYGEGIGAENFENITVNRPYGTSYIQVQPI